MGMDVQALLRLDADLKNFVDDIFVRISPCVAVGRQGLDVLECALPLDTGHVGGLVLTKGPADGKPNQGAGFAAGA